MSEFTLTPRVDQAQEFIEIANDFSNALDLVREAISNSFDAHAGSIDIEFDVIKKYGESILQITITDDGDGMDRAGLQSFFDLGNSLRRNDPTTIGEKGHGTKVYFNSSEIKVRTIRNGTVYTATMIDPYRKLFDREIPTVAVEEQQTTGGTAGTTIVISGYNRNRRELFTHEILKDHILWFTKFGSIETAFGIDTHKHVVLRLKGLRSSEFEILRFGHFFPAESTTIQDLFDEHLADAPKYYCRKIIKVGQLKNFPEITYRAIFAVEGNRIKQQYNPMLRRQGYPAPDGAYTVQDRYGLWLCKDHIPIQRVNEWISTRGSEFTRFHAFFNCQEFRLTANRGSLNNTPTEVLQDIKREVENIYNQITDSQDWKDMTWLEGQADAYRTTDKETKDFDWRKRKFNQSNVAQFEGHTLVAPSHESGLYGLVIQLVTIKSDFFPFEIIDYNTHNGIDVIVKSDHTAPIHQSKLYYAELKFILSKELNHSFRNLFSIVCWDTAIKHGDNITDLNGETRIMRIVGPMTEGDCTKYFLDNPAAPHKIQVYVLKDFLKERYNIEFRPRTDKGTI
jgi:hypothetical protein